MRNQQKIQVISLKAQFFLHSASYACQIMDWKTLISSQRNELIFSERHCATEFACQSNLCQIWFRFRTGIDF